MTAKPGKYWNASWNPITGCTPRSPACLNCWARGMAERLPQIHGKRMHFAGTVGPVRRDIYEPIPFSQIVVHSDRLDQPLHWRLPRVIAVCWMGDLFHEDVPDDDLHDVILSLRVSPQHTFLLLTKRIERVAKFLEGWGDWPHLYSNVWLGVSVWDQESADKNIPILLDTPAAHRWVSYEPALGAVDFSPWLRPQTKTAYYSRGGRGMSEQVTVRREHLDWVVAGCESGPRARHTPCKWLRDVQMQCLAAPGPVPCFVKQASGEPGEPKVIRFAPLPENLPLEMQAIASQQGGMM